MNLPLALLGLLEESECLPCKLPEIPKSLMGVATEGDSMCPTSISENLRVFRETRDRIHPAVEGRPQGFLWESGFVDKRSCREGQILIEDSGGFSFL
jgi:hypothetical protein